MFGTSVGSDHSLSTKVGFFFLHSFCRRAKEGGEKQSIKVNTQRLASSIKSNSE